MKVLVLGGTGHLGRDVIRAARQSGGFIRVASRCPRPADTPESLEWVEADLATGRGIPDAVQGVDAIVFSAGNPKNHAAVEVEGLKRLIPAAVSAGVSHCVFISIVGADHIPLPYYQTKVAAERVLAEGRLPYTILRATQFHSFVDQLLSGLARFPLALPIPKGFRVQPVATEDVARRVVRCLSEGPRWMLRDFCGPQILPLEEMAAQWKAARRRSKPLVQVPVPGAVAAAFRRFHNTNPFGELGTVTWTEWLARSTPPAEAFHREACAGYPHAYRRSPA